MEDDGVKYPSTYFPAVLRRVPLIEKRPISMKKVASSARLSLLPLFSSIIRENHEKMTEIELRVKKHGQHSVIRAEEEIAKTSIIIVVFSAMTIESYIYDYAARHLGDTFVKDHLDKLDTLSKWIIIPELITGKEMPRHENWRELLKTLIKVRNSLIHHKSSEPPSILQDGQKYLKKLSDESNLIYKTAQQSITLLGLLADKIIEIDPDESPWVKSYLI